VAVVAALVGAVVTACDASDPRPQPTRSDVGGAGRILYLTHCEGCHGLSGAGDGPAAAWLRVAPADLTRLWERYGTPLDRDDLAEHIDGRMLSDFHGLREMPVWGDEFFEDAPPGSRNVEMARRRLIEVLIEYLETLQTRRKT
jgi:mono/diheme cytochrome c family protein